MRHTTDSRGESWWDLFPDLIGQVNVSLTLPLEIRAFHMHSHKVDNVFVVKGKYKVVLLYPDSGAVEHTLVVGDALSIQPGVWHGFQNIGDSDGIMVYYETKKSGPDCDDDLVLDKEAYNGWE